MVFLILLFITSFLGYGTASEPEFYSKSLVTEQNIPEITFAAFKEKEHNFCDSFNYEIVDLYSSCDTCSTESSWLFLDDELRHQGFELVNSGRGNWQSGARFIHLELVKDNCHCTINKKYWDPAFTADSTFAVTEQIICNQPETGNFFLGD